MKGLQMEGESFVSFLELLEGNNGSTWWMKVVALHRGCS